MLYLLKNQGEVGVNVQQFYFKHYYKFCRFGRYYTILYNYFVLELMKLELYFPFNLLALFELIIDEIRRLICQESLARHNLKLLDETTERK